MFPLRLFSLIACYKILSLVPCAIQQVLVYAMYTSVYLLSPNLSLPSFPSGNLKFIFYVSECLSVLEINSFVSFFRFHI